MSISYKETKETIRIKDGKVHMDLVGLEGFENEVHVIIVPSLNFTGYGSSKKEARETLELSLKLFAQELVKLSHDLREVELAKYGFAKEKFANKNFSKAYVDENGALQGLELGPLKQSRIAAFV